MVGHHFKLTKINIHKTGPVLQSEPFIFHKIELYLCYLNIHVSTASAIEKSYRNTTYRPAFVLDDSGLLCLHSAELKTQFFQSVYLDTYSLSGNKS